MLLGPKFKILKGAKLGFFNSRCHMETDDTVPLRDFGMKDNMLFS
jgi:hypothetical protein